MFVHRRLRTFFYFWAKSRQHLKPHHRTISTKIREDFSTQFYLSKMSVRNVWTLKLLPASSLQTLPYHFYEKNRIKKFSPPNFYSQEEVNNIMTAKIPLRIGYLDFFTIFTKKITPNFQPPKRGEKSICQQKIL